MANTKIQKEDRTMRKVEYIVVSHGKSNAFNSGGGEVIATVKAISRAEAVKEAHVSGASAHPGQYLKAILWSEAKAWQRQDAKMASIETTCWCGKGIRQWEDSLQFGTCAHHRGA